MSTYNSYISERLLPNELKTGDIFSLFKNDDAFYKKNYRPIVPISPIQLNLNEFVWLQHHNVVASATIIRFLLRANYEL